MYGEVWETDPPPLFPQTCFIFIKRQYDADNATARRDGHPAWQHYSLKWELRNKMRTPCFNKKSPAKTDAARLTSVKIEGARF